MLCVLHTDVQWTTIPFTHLVQDTVSSKHLWLKDVVHDLLGECNFFG